MSLEPLLERDDPASNKMGASGRKDRNEANSQKGKLNAQGGNVSKVEQQDELQFNADTWFQEAKKQSRNHIRNIDQDGNYKPELQKLIDNTQEKTYHSFVIKFIDNFKDRYKIHNDDLKSVEELIKKLYSKELVKQIEELAKVKRLRQWLDVNDLIMNSKNDDKGMITYKTETLQDIEKDIVTFKNMIEVQA